MNDDAYKRFREAVPRRRTVMEHAHENVVFEYYDEGQGEVLVLLPPVCASAACFYGQIQSLCTRGYRVISVSWPPIADATVLVKVLDVFFDQALSLEKFHLLGSGLGGYLAQLYVQHRPTRVQSLMLVNAFCDTAPFRRASQSLYAFFPDFMIQRAMLDMLPRQEGDDDADNGRALGFLVECIETDLSAAAAASRLTLTAMDPSPLDPVTMRERFGGDERVTILETLDEKSGLTEAQKASMGKYYYGARLALMKRGGSFPFLSQPEEFNMYVQVHLRRNSMAPA